jgi:hypothetical protein
MYSSLLSTKNGEFICKCIKYILCTCISVCVCFSFPGVGGEVCAMVRLEYATYQYRYLVPVVMVSCSKCFCCCFLFVFSFCFPSATIVCVQSFVLLQYVSTGLETNYYSKYPLQLNYMPSSHTVLVVTRVVVICTQFLLFVSSLCLRLLYVSTSTHHLTFLAPIFPPSPPSQFIPLLVCSCT